MTDAMFTAVGLAFAQYEVSKISQFPVSDSFFFAGLALHYEASAVCSSGTSCYDVFQTSRCLGLSGSCICFQWRAAVCSSSGLAAMGLAIIPHSQLRSL